MSKNEKKINQKQVARLVRGIIAQKEEVKQFQVNAAPTAVFTGAGFYQSPLLSIAVGAGANQRTGDSVNLRSIDMRLSFYNGIGATSNINTVFRVFVFQFFGDSTIAAPAPMTYMLLGSALNAGGVTGAFSAISEDYKRQFHILYDASVHLVGSAALAATGNTGGSGIYKTMALRLPLGKCQKRIQYVAGGTNTTNGLYVLATTDQATIATNPTFGFDCSVLYTDS